MRDFLYTEIGSFYGMPNIPEYPDKAIWTGTRLCLELLDPMVETFGSIHVRSSYRSRDINRFGNENGLNCGNDSLSRGNHVWDMQDDQGMRGATACVVVPWFADQFENGRDWRDLAWWLHDHLPYSDIVFFTHLAAFNIRWREVPRKRIASWIGGNKVLKRIGEEPAEPLATRRSRYADFPPFRGIAMPRPPGRWR
ncbi:MAG: hypothetical protein AAF982_05750 [Pseudomonadota bacterium]